MESSVSQQNWKDLEIIWDYLNLKVKLPKKADVIIVGGEGNLIDAAIRASELYKKKIAPLIIFSGFANPYLHGKQPEAEILSKVAIRNGVPKTAIILEPKATNTAENITNSVIILKKHNIQPKNVILVHKPYMTRRFLATAQAYWPKPQPNLFSTSIETNIFDFYKLNQKIDGKNNKMIELMLGDYERTKTYPQYGWMTKQPIYKKVEKAYQRLINSGLSAKPLKK